MPLQLNRLARDQILRNKASELPPRRSYPGNPVKVTHYSLSVSLAVRVCGHLDRDRASDSDRAVVSHRDGGHRASDRDGLSSTLTPSSMRPLSPTRPGPAEPESRVTEHHDSDASDPIIMIDSDSGWPRPPLRHGHVTRTVKTRDT
jgi:hypothetical protein